MHSGEKNKTPRKGNDRRLTESIFGKGEFAVGDYQGAWWNRLDNAAKIFPPTSSKRDTKVFRFACELNELVDGNVLQKALDKTLEAFPIYRSVLRHGLFWYYFESSNLPAEVQQEWEPPCSSIYDSNRKSLLFKVTYFRCRINLEIYHALSDGTGAMQFLRLLVYHYLLFRHPEDLKNTPQMDYDASFSQKMDDSFQKYYDKNGRKGNARHPKAYRIKGQKLPEHRIRVIEGVVSVKQALAKAHGYNATLTGFLTALLLCAIHEDRSLRDQQKPVVLEIPVNLRKYFPSESARNFFSVISAGYDFSKKPPDFEQVIRAVDDCFQKELTPEQLSLRMNTFAAIEHNPFARVTPLILKDVALKIGYHAAAKESTGALSNIGKISMPQELIPYIRLFDVFVSTNKLQICLCSFEDNLTLSFTSPFISTDIQKRFFRSLTSMGLEVEIASNLIH